MIMDIQENSVKLSFRSVSSVATILAKSDQLVRARPCPLLQTKLVFHEHFMNPAVPMRKPEQINDKNIF
jgi:hypothetical protein